MAQARTNTLLAGKEIMIAFQKPGAAAFTLFGCVTSIDYDSPGASEEKTVCRAGTFKSVSGDKDLPTISLENVVRIFPTAETADNITDAEIQEWVEAADTPIIQCKYYVGEKAGDFVYTGPGFFNGFNRKGPQTGNATAGVKFNFTEMPVRSTVS